MTAELQAKDVCIYGPGDLNKIGKEGKTSWDSFSYAIQMGHNVWSHINAVQEANRQYDAGVYPKMLVREHDGLKFKDVVEAVFMASTRDEANAVLDAYAKFFDTIIGTRGNTGKRIVNAETQFQNHYETVDIESIVSEEELKVWERPKEQYLSLIHI